jgi:OmpA-OmpF porin, OOP family
MQFPYTSRRSSQSLAAALLCPALLLAAHAVHAQSPARSASGPAYQPVPPAAANQAQVVYFRPAAEAGSTASGAAHIYLNGQFHTALQPGSFTRFCVTPGSYTLEGYIDEGPEFSGKSNPRTRVDLQGGKTYFAAVGKAGEPVPTLRREAESRLAGSFRQEGLVSRAKAAQPCEERADYVPQDSQASPLPAPSQMGRAAQPEAIALAHGAG